MNDPEVKTETGPLRWTPYKVVTRTWAKSTISSMPYATNSRRIAYFKEQEQTSMPRGDALGRRHTPEHRSVRECTRSPPSRGVHVMEVKEHLISKKLQPITTAPKPRNTQKYCEFHEQNGHTTIECRESRKGLHELANKGKIDHFLKGRLGTLRGGVFYRDSSHHCKQLYLGHHSVHLEGSASRTAVVDIIPWDCLKKIKHLGREIVHLVHPILGFGGKT
ncbi:LOW QUALITY PROTEIN: hypothetical protein Cgig2_020661 [Carnegiea gigantea]|uniref:Reverse transcriptase domain-containing protein n=1 Tax=Carnegiea gigantea TaxID=171969 RepID=A0A9Q1KIQ4_9CARY|nr:LOW QUALITY PROTEIN: hypothetical protein Cgig2_020661 [Carnegiea gigantea]